MVTATGSPVVKAFRDGTRPPSRLSVVEWAERHVRLPHSARSPQFSIDAAPWLREPMETIADNTHREVVIVAPTGSGKSTLLEGLIPWIVSEEPGPLLATSQTDEDAKDWAETRLMPVLKGCFPLRDLWPKDRSHSRKLEILFPHMPLFLGGANISNLQSKSMRWVIGDEVWLWKPGMLGEARKRTHDRWNSRVVLVSQGSVVGDDFHSAFHETDRREFQWECRGCGGRRPWTWKQIQWEEHVRNGSMDWGEIANTVRLECPECGEVYRDVPQDRRALSISGRYVVDPEAVPTPGHVGFRYPAAAVWWIPWLTLVREWWLANREMDSGNSDPLRQFIQKRLGDFWEERSDTPDLRFVGDPYEKSEYHDGRKIDNEAFRFLTVDVQKGHFWAVVRAWESSGATSLLWEGRLETYEMIRHLEERFHVPGKCVFIDGRWDSETIVPWVAKSATWDPEGRGWNVLMGDRSTAGFPIYRGKRKRFRSFSSWIRSKTSTGIPFRFVKFSNFQIKNALSALMSKGGPEFRVPTDVSEDYRKQMASEHKVEIRPGVWEWKKIKEHYPNHLWDCECMQVTAASIFGILSADLGTDGDG